METIYLKVNTVKCNNRAGLNVKSNVQNSSSHCIYIYITFAQYISLFTYYFAGYYIYVILQESRLAEVTSNIWGTKFRIHGIFQGLYTILGQVTYKTSLLHLQPRQMTLQIAGEGGQDTMPATVTVSEDEEEGGEARGAPVAPLTRTRCNRGKDPRSTECFMTRSSFRDCECGEGDEVGVAVVADKSRRGVVRSCSVGYLDLVESGASNNRFVLLQLDMYLSHLC